MTESNESTPGSPFAAFFSFVGEPSPLNIRLLDNYFAVHDFANLLWLPRRFRKGRGDFSAPRSRHQKSKVIP